MIICMLIWYTTPLYNGHNWNIGSYTDDIFVSNADYIFCSPFLGNSAETPEFRLEKISNGVTKGQVL